VTLSGEEYFEELMKFS
jgi:hypothetical protein